MGLTHLSRLDITPTASKGDLATEHALEVNTSRLSTGRALKITKATTEKLWIGSGGQMQVGGTLTASAAAAVRKISSFYGTANFTGMRMQFQRWATISIFTGGGSAIAGRRTITTGGSGVVSTKRITGTALLFVTAQTNTGIANVICYEKRGARVAGTSFKVMLKQVTGTSITGSVNWFILRTSAAGA